ncbi:MAG: calcium-binding protein [Planctomycetota bacterium]
MSTPPGWLNFPSRLLCLASALAAPATSQVTVRVSVDSLGAQGNDGSYYPSISADGRYVAFWSYAPLVAGDTNGAPDIFVRDLQSGGTELVSVDSLGAQGNDGSYYPSISADGRYVAFQSHASNLVSGDTNSSTDIFVRDRQSSTTERVSLDSLETQANSFSDSASISADGRFVAFVSTASNLVSGDTNQDFDVFVRDRQSGTTERASVDTLGAQGNEASYGPSISADGRFVVFVSSADNLVSGDTPGTFDTFLRDRQNGTTERVGLESFTATISADGRYVAFESLNLAFGVFVHDRQSGTTELVSVDSLGVPANSACHTPSISADGRFVAFMSLADNLVGGDTDLHRDIFVRDRQSGTTERVSVDSLGMQGNADSSLPSLSSDGRVAFQSLASNLVSGDTNLDSDVFVHTRCDPATSTTFAGDGINADTITPVNAVLGSSWSAPLTIGHAHGSGGPLVLKLRRSTVNGPNFISPVGGRLTEVLITGPLYGTFSGTHNGVTGDIAPQAIPNDLALVGLTWAAQYTVSGGGFADLSQAVVGVVGCP